MTQYLYRVDVSLGDDHALRSYAVWAENPDAAERAAVGHASDLLDVTAYEVSSEERERFNEDDYDERITLPVKPVKYQDVVMLEDETRKLIGIAVAVAVEELQYRVSELSDTGDYEPEDIATMTEELDQLYVLQRTMFELFKKS